MLPQINALVTVLHTNFNMAILIKSFYSVLANASTPVRISIQIYYGRQSFVNQDRPANQDNLAERFLKIVVYMTFPF